MENERRAQRYRDRYRKLLHFYPRPYRERFGAGMEQTFNDLCRERVETGGGLSGILLWLFAETSAGIIKENITFIAMQNITRRLGTWAIVVAFILMIPLVLTIRDGGIEGAGWNWTFSDFVIMGSLLFGAGLVYELVSRKMSSGAYRKAIGLAVVTAVVLFWMNGAVGIIGNENNPANLMYFGVLAIGMIGAAIAQFRPKGMARVMFAMAFAQMLVPLIALATRDSTIVLELPGVLGVLILNAFFALSWTGSALLFRRAAR